MPSSPATPLAKSYEVRAPEPPPWIDAPDHAVDTQPASVRSSVSAPAGEARATGGSASAIPSEADARRLGDRWSATVAALIEAASIGALVRELAMQAQCIAIDDSATPMRWRLRVERETLRAASHCEKLQAALQGLLGRPVRIETEGGAAVDTPALREAAERAARQAEAEQTIENDPLVRALMSQYKTARIVPGSVKSL